MTGLPVMLTLRGVPVRLAASQRVVGKVHTDPGFTSTRQPYRGYRNIIFFSFLTACLLANQTLTSCSEHFCIPWAHFFSLPPTAWLIDVSPVIELHCGRDSQVTGKSRGHHRFRFFWAFGAEIASHRQLGRIQLKVIVALSTYPISVTKRPRHLQFVR
jgi:hypothetical protein